MPLCGAGADDQQMAIQARLRSIGGRQFLDRSAQITVAVTRRKCVDPHGSLRPPELIGKTVIDQNLCCIRVAPDTGSGIIWQHFQQQA